MNALLSALEERGCDVAGALAQFNGSEDFYARRFKQVIADQRFEELGSAIRKRDADTAYRHAQEARRDADALGLTPIGDLLGKMAPTLRAGLCDKGVENLHKSLMVQVKVYRILAIRDGGGSGAGGAA